MNKMLEYDCLTFNQNGKDIVFFKALARDLLEFASVARKSTDNPDGYQRMFSEHRKKSIAKYINDNNIIPNSILISLDEAELNEKKNKITFENKPNTAWIIDGQHRVLGASFANKEIELPIVALLNATENEQVLQFVTINREAKGVPSSLYIDLLGRLPRELNPKETAQNRASDIANKLNEDEYSPFYGRIATTSSPKAGQISKSNFVKKVEQLVFMEKGRLSDYTMSEQVKIFNNYFKAIEEIFPNELKKERPIYYQTIGFGGFMKSFEVIFNTVISKNQGSFMVQDIIDLLKLISVDLEESMLNWAQSGTGEKAENYVANEIKTFIRQLNEQDGTQTSIRL